MVHYSLGIKISAALILVYVLHTSFRRPSCHPFLIMTTQRSGSHYFLDLLATHPSYQNIIGEVVAHKNGTLQINPKITSLENLFAEKQGALVHYNQFVLLESTPYRGILAKSFVRNNVALIHLQRRPFDVVVSRFLRKSTSIVHCKRSPNCTYTPETAKISIDPQSFVAEMKKIYNEKKKALD
jgi:hypothetical protein